MRTRESWFIFSEQCEKAFQRGISLEVRIDIGHKESRRYPYPAYQRGFGPGQDAALVQCASSSAIEAIESILGSFFVI